jgi:hypothetical protein
MARSSWLRALLSRNVNSVSRRRKLAVETLEDRCVPSLFTTTRLTDSAFGYSTYGNAVSFIATVTDEFNGFAVTEGAVTFSDSSSGGFLSTTVNLNAYGQAIITTSSPLSAGSHDVTANYNDNVSFNYISSFSSDLLTVNPASTFTTLRDSASGVATPGQTVTFTASVADANGFAANEGAVDFSVGGVLLARSVPLISGQARFTPSTPFSAGSYTVTAKYHDDNFFQNYSSSSGSDSLSVTVGTPIAPPPPGSGVFSGTVFHDFNTNGVQDPGEPGLAGQTVYLDLDGSGVLKSADPTATTDANGNYQFTGLANGTYTVREVLLGGVLLSAPASGSYQATVTNGGSVTGDNFADVLTSIAVPLTLPPSTTFPPQGSGNADYVEAVYRAVLDRNADAGGLANWTNLLNSGAATRLQVVQGIRNSPEHFTQEVTDFYMTLLGRAPDAAGLQNWVGQLEGGMPEEKMAFYFLDSPEYLSEGDKHFVDAMYQSLLGRSFDSAGEASWLNQLSTATQTHQQVVTDFLYSTEALTRLTEGYYETFLQRLADSGGLSSWVGQLQQGLSFLTIGQQFLSSAEFYNRAAANG